MALENALKKQRRQQEQETGIRHNPEVDAKIDTFIGENPGVFDKINAYSKDELVRKRILDIVNANERRQGYREEVREFVEQNPTVKQEVEKRMKRIPEAQREAAFVRIARSVAATVGMKQGAAANPY